MRIVRGGTLDREILNLLLLNVRTPVEREGDLTAQIGACRVGELRLKEMIAKYGRESIARLGGELLAYSERLTRAELARMPGGQFVAEDYLDDDGYNETPVKIRVSITIDPHQPAGREQRERGVCDYLLGGVLRLPLPAAA